MGAATCPGDEKGTIHLGLLMGAPDCPGGGNGTIHLGLLMEAAECPGGENGGDSSLIGDSLLLLRIFIACCVTCSAWEDTKQNVVLTCTISTKRYCVHSHNMSRTAEVIPTSPRNLSSLAVSERLVHYLT